MLDTMFKYLGRHDKRFKGLINVTLPWNAKYYCGKMYGSSKVVLKMNSINMNEQIINRRSFLLARIFLPSTRYRKNRSPPMYVWWCFWRLWAFERSKNKFNRNEHDTSLLVTIPQSACGLRLNFRSLGVYHFVYQI